MTVEFSSLDKPLHEDLGATKGDLVAYLRAVADRIVPVLTGRALSVIRVREGQEAFMQKNVPKYTPAWIATTTQWAEASKRNVRYALCDDEPTLMWFANQRAVEYHVPLFRAGSAHPDALVLDLDPPEGDDFAHVVRAARLVETALADCGLTAVVKTSGSKGVHIVVPLVEGTTFEDTAAATRALAARAERVDPAVATTAYLKEDRGGKVFLDSTRAGGATVAAAYSPRNRPGVPVSFPVAWPDLEAVHPRDFTIFTAAALLGDADPWRERMPAPQRLPADLVAEGHTIPIARVVAMHEGKRRKRAAREAGPPT